MLYGDMYRLLPMLFLDGPQAWVTELSAHRREKHAERVAGISAIQSKLNRAYRVPYGLNELHQDFFDKYRVPQFQVYIHNLPEMQENELLEMVLTWFGMVWIGNPFVSGVKVLYQEFSSHHGEVQT